jgi:hypothetical protein
LVGRAHPAPFVRLLDRYFYFGMSLLILVVVTAGFSITVPAHLFHAKIAPPHIVWLHGVVFYGWVLFFILQSGLVKIRKTRLHRTIGWFGFALGITVFGLGISTTIVMHRFEFLTLHRQSAIRSISIPLLDMVCFAVAFSLAILWRKKLEYHRRLMLIASCALTAAAWGRLLNSTMVPFWWFYAGVDLLIMMGVVRDLLVNRKVHRVYLTTLPLFIASQIATWQITYTEWWLRIAKSILF